MTCLSLQTISHRITTHCKTVKIFYIMEVIEVRLRPKPKKVSKPKKRFSASIQLLKASNDFLNTLS